MSKEFNAPVQRKLRYKHQISRLGFFFCLFRTIFLKTENANIQNDSFLKSWGWCYSGNIIWLTKIGLLIEKGEIGKLIEGYFQERSLLMFTLWYFGYIVATLTLWAAAISTVQSTISQPSATKTRLHKYSSTSAYLQLYLTINPVTGYRTSLDIFN